MHVSKYGKVYPIQVISNTTVLNFKETPGSIKLSVSGEAGTSGYVRVIQPIGLNSSNIKVFLNHTRLTIPSNDPPASISKNTTHYFIYFTYTLQSNYTISVQFPILADITGKETGVPDGKVDNIDLAFVAMRFGIGETDPLWSDHADITGQPPMIPDGKVDIREIYLIGRNYEEIWPP